MNSCIINLNNNIQWRGGSANNTRWHRPSLHAVSLYAICGHVNSTRARACFASLSGQANATTAHTSYYMREQLTLVSTDAVSPARNAALWFLWNRGCMHTKQSDWIITRHFALVMWSHAISALQILKILQHVYIYSTRW